MTIQEFKTHIEGELRHKLKCDNEPTPILDRLELHLKDFDDYDLTDLLNPKNMKHDLYASFLFQICFPSRIKMDIDAEYTPIKKKRIAIVSCKSTKQDYTCSADEMYSVSPIYRIQREFFIKGYDDWYIMSSKYGIIHHTQIIEPYNNTVGVLSTYQKPENVIQGWDSSVINNIEKQLNWMVKHKSWEVDLHISMSYYKPLPKHIKEMCKHIRQPMGPGTPLKRYAEANNLLNTLPLDKILTHIPKRPNKQPEQNQWWYHPNYKKFFGTSGNLAIQYKKDGIQAGNAYNVGLGKVSQHKGWVTDKSFLDKLYQTDSGQWRLKR